MGLYLKNFLQAAVVNLLYKSPKIIIYSPETPGFGVMRLYSKYVS